MKLDHDRANSKRDELVATISAAALRCEPATQAGILAVASDIVSAACTISSPESSGTFVEFITLSEGGRSGASSVKPGNVTLNFKKLFTTIAAGGLTLTGVSTAPPWAVVMMGLVLWDSLWSPKGGYSGARGDGPLGILGQSK